MICQSCTRTFEIKGQVPVFSPEPVVIAPVDHISNPIGAEYEEILRQGKDFVLHIGAGATRTKYRNCIEFEHKIFKNTDIVGDAHQLPFRNDIFDRVFAFNVFEHLADPPKVAAEILRVLKPGGSVAIHTAFLQALHEAPRHYYNATEFGVERWFSNFDIERCEVSGNFGPGLMLGFLLASVFDAVRAAGVPWNEQAIIDNTTLGEWAEFWAGKAEPPPGFHTLQNLPQEFQKRVAAGFELIARRPPTQ
jgi:SAM-dependent methyltransferase